MSQVTLTWSVQNMTRVLDDGFVINVAWACTASATGVQGAFYGGKSTFAAPDSNAPDFIPYDQLTEEVVLGWVYDALGDQKVEIEATLTAKVEAQLNPVTANGLPWDNTPEQA